MVLATGFIPVNCLPHNKILDLSKFKSFVDDKINVTEKAEILFGMVRKHWEKEKMLVTSIFSFSRMFSKAESKESTRPY